VKTEVEMIKFENKLENLSQPDDTRLLDNEHNFIRKKIDEAKGEINQLENNLQFFSNIDETNPLVKNVLKNIEGHKDNLAVWEEKLKKIKELY
jgi:chromosome segregation ATPase